MGLHRTGVRHTVIAIGISAVGLATGLSAQQVGRISVEAQLLAPPAIVKALGRAHIVYELHVTNFGAQSISLQQLDVLGDAQAPIGSWTGAALRMRVAVIGQPAGGLPTDPIAVAPGARAVTFVWITLDPGAKVPSALSHRLTFTTGADTDTITTPPTAVNLPTHGSVAAPVHGGPWLAVRGPSAASGHRLSLVATDGRVRVPQRFAVDWARLGDDGRLFRGDGAQLTDWYGYGETVHAVAAGTVVLVRDTIADTAPRTPAPAIIDAAAAPGNVVVLELADTRRATYAHLKPGSIRVKAGDRVTEGQPLAAIGSSGNSLGPHLHFHLTDAVEPLGGEGLPYALHSFKLTGRVMALPALLGGTPWTPSPAQPARVVTDESPLENMVVEFKSR